jgi:hypothetical protein
MKTFLSAERVNKADEMKKRLKANLGQQHYEWRKN